MQDKYQIDGWHLLSNYTTKKVFQYMNFSFFG